jgi:hypothetical protein
MPRSPDISCRCGEKILRNLPDGTVKISCKVMVMRPEENVFSAICKKCDRAVEVPIRIAVKLPEKVSHYILEKDRKIVDEK